MNELLFDPDQKVEGFDIAYRDITLGGNCWMGMPAIFILHQVKIELPEGHSRYPETEEQYERYGSQLPDVIEETVLDDVQIGCKNYQALVAAGVDVTPCTTCPLLQ